MKVSFKIIEQLCKAYSRSNCHFYKKKHEKKKNSPELLNTKPNYATEVKYLTRSQICEQKKHVISQKSQYFSFLNYPL